MNRLKEIFFPSFPIKDGDIENYLNNLNLEIEAGLYEKSELTLLLTRKLYGRYLSFKNKQFFLYHFIPLWEYSIKKIFNYKKEPNVLDLGCATGTSSFLFSSMGAKTIGVDLQEELISICNKRKNIYTKSYKNFEGSYFQSDVFLFPYENYAPFDVIFSLFAFNLMQPSKKLIEKIIPSLTDGGIIIIIDGNQSSIYSKLIPSRKRNSVLKPSELKDLLKIYNFSTVDLKYFCFIPPIFFRFKFLLFIGKIIEKCILFLKLEKIFGTTFSITAVKK